MKNFLLLLATIPCLIFSQSEQEEFLPYPVESKEPIENVADLVKRKAYVTVGTALLYQKIGTGNRWHNYTKGIGHDISLNVIVFPGVAKIVDSIWTSAWLIPIEWDYCYLNYKILQEGSNFPYFGIGIGVVGCIIPDLGMIVPWLNPKIVVGKEYADGRFSQLSLNLIPVAVTAACLAFQPDEPGDILPFGMGISIECSIGF